MKKVLYAVVASALLSSAPGAAQHVIEGKVGFLSTSELKSIYGKGSLVLVNTLSPVEFRERIAGSINVPLSHYADGRVTLPDDREARFVFYCMGGG